MSYWEIRDALRQLMVRAEAFDCQLKSDDPDWDDLWPCHVALCRVERYLKIKENG